MSRPRAARVLVLVLAGAAPGLGACLNSYPQRVPGPMVLPPNVAAPAAVAEALPSVVVQRNSDPVWVRRPGERDGYALAFYRKRERVPVGTLVRTGAGGRAEVLWSPDASSVVLFDECRATLGDPARDEPFLRLHSLTRALLVLTPEDRVELVGGALLAGDPVDSCGPILLESAPHSILRVTNQSKRLVTIAFRELRLELGPGESLDMPLLATGAAPRPEEGEPSRLESGGVAVALRGALERTDQADGVMLTARESAVVEGLGVQARLAPGERARFSALPQVGPRKPADPGARP